MRKGCRPTIRTGCGFNLRRLCRRRLKMLRQQHDTAVRRKEVLPRAAEGFNWVSAKFGFGCADSRFAEPRSSLWEGFNFVSGKLLFGWADSRFGKPRAFPKRERFYSFRLYEKNQKYPRGLRTSGLPGTIQSSAGNTFGEASGGTRRNRFFAQDGGEKVLNRCEVQALQREDLERTTKEQLYSFADSRLWLGGNLWCLEWKRIALDSDKERFWKKKGFWLVKINSFKCS